jgi:predicted dehydrogenase
MDRIRWGILGCADIVERRFLPALTKEVQNGEIYALATRGNSERLSRVTAAYDIPKVYHEYDALLADPAVDAVYIPVPNSLHAQWTIRAARAKKHVLCEKPMACSVADVERIRAAAEENCVVVMEAFACLHSPLYGAIRDLVDAGEIGELTAVDSVFCYNMTNRDTNNIGNPALCGGSIYDVGCYNTLTIRKLTGREPVSISAKAHFWENGLDATVRAVLDMGDNLLCAYTSSVETASHRGLSVLGTQGYIHFPHTPNTWGELLITLNNENGSREIKLQVRNTYALEMEQMGRCILQGERPLLTLEDSAKNVRALEMLHDAIGSWRSGL